MTTLQAEKPFLGRYELQKKIAVGGMAELYLAQVNGVGGFQKQVVVKRILPQLAESEELFRMFLDEARIAATLQHPNVVQIYDSCQEDGEYFMAMEYLDGTDLRTLRKVLADKTLPLPWEHALHIVTSIAAGLHYAHDKRGLDGVPLGIVHRDVTPHNIFLTREGGVKLVDFGIAKAQGRMTETALGTLKGKLAYMSPEQCQGEEIDRRSDIYSLGIILFELTTGRRLYKGTTEYQLIKEIVEGEIKPPSSFMEYPEDLEAIVLKCLQKNPEDRYASAREIQADLEAFSRDYQIMSSSLGFSTFLEPLLEEAAAAAETRWKHRKDVMPIRLGKSGAVGMSTSARPQPALNAAAAVQSPLRAHGSAPRASTVASTVAPLPRPSQSPDPSPPNSMFAFGAKPVASAPARAQSVPMYTEEEMTVRVPTDTLERIRAEEKAHLEAERLRAEQDAIPRMARGTGSGEHSVSVNVVSRESSKIIVEPDDIYESDIFESVDIAINDSAIEEATIVAPLPVAPSVQATAPVQTPAPIVQATAPVQTRDSAPEDGQLGHDDIARAVSHTAVVAKATFTPAPKRAASSQAEVYTDLSDEDLRVTAKSGSLWIAGVCALGVLGGGLLWSQQGNSEKASTVATIALPQAEVGTLSVGGAAGADVWLFLGRTPIQTMAINGEREHRVRIEHEGYQSYEATLGQDTWKRDDNGTQYADGNVHLLSAGTEKPVPAAAPEASGELQGTRPSSVHLASTPSSANAWLFVGTTPNVTVGNLDLSGDIQLRIEQGKQPPIFRVLHAGDFDAAGTANIEIAEIAPEPATEAAVETPVKTAPAPAKKWRPRRAPAGTGGPARSARKSGLGGPTPDWAK